MTASLSAFKLAERTEMRRVAASLSLRDASRRTLGQFFTPAPLAALLASMFESRSEPLRVLDPGAGAGSLTAALVARMAAERWPCRIELHAVEVDEDVLPSLKDTLAECELALPSASTTLHSRDFIEWAGQQLRQGLFTTEASQFDLAILNPPYCKLKSVSRERQILRAIGIEATNLYSAFVALSLRLLAPGGQLVAITPRSFCNGPYFQPFRELILGEAVIRGIHVFETRDQAFRDTAVLQENVIIHLVRGGDQGEVTVSSSDGSGLDPVVSRRVPFKAVVHPGDRHRFIHVVADETESNIAGRIGRLASALPDLDASVSTGRVVDFRAREYLRMTPEPGTIPLLYPMHLRDGRIQWPGTSAKKCPAIASNSATAKLLLPRGHYVLVKRFSAKEERRRVVATVLEEHDLDTEMVAIENHINVFHHRNHGLGINLAWGLATYLNSTILDQFFRQFNGHTQVNATDLRSLRYPSPSQLITLGNTARSSPRDQSAIDALVSRFVPELADR